MTLLNQIVAVESSVRSAADASVNKAYHTIQKEGLFDGQTRTYTPRDDDGEKLPDESVKVQHTADELVAQVTKAWTRLFDVTFTKDVANTEAKADVVVIVNGRERVLVSDAPVPHLLFLEKKLVDLRTFVAKLPLLDPALNWSHDENSGVYRSDEVKTTKTKKVPRALVLAPATPQHPAQVQVFNEDQVVGDWSMIKFSGRISRDRQVELADRIEAVLEAVKAAREKANSYEVTDQRYGAEIFTFLFGAPVVPTPEPVTSPILRGEDPQTPA